MKNLTNRRESNLIQLQRGVANGHSVVPAYDYSGSGRPNLFYDLNELREAAMSYSSILIPLDGSRVAAEAVPYGTALANMFRLPMTLMRVVAPTDATLLNQSPSGRENDSLRSQAQGYLASFKQSLSVLGHEIEVCVEEGEPVEGILRAAQSLSKPLLVLGTGGRSASSAPAATEGLGRVAEQLIIQWRGPILLVGRNSRHSGETSK